MIFTITKGMDGKRIETLGKYSIDNISKMFADFYEWKKNADLEKYYISSYERHLMNDKTHKMIIDFGDYSYFGLIKASKKEWEILRSYTPPPADLEV